MPAVARTITVGSPPDAVWRFVSDFTTTEEWDPPTVSTERTSGAGGVGTTYHNVAKFHGRRTEIDFVVTAYDEGHRLSVRGTAWGLEVLDTIVVVALRDGGSLVSYEARFTVLNDEVPPFGADELDTLGDLVAESLEDSLAQLAV